MADFFAQIRFPNEFIKENQIAFVFENDEVDNL